MGTCDDDLVIGGSDNDVLFGGGGSDTIIGGAGDDVINAGDDYTPTSAGWIVSTTGNVFDRLWHPITVDLPSPANDAMSRVADRLAA